MARGRLITVEGIDGAGKSTLVEGIVAARPNLTLLREPGGVALSERIRTVVKDPTLTVGARAEALLYAAARAQLVEEKLRPLLASGTDVLLDRFLDSSLAYQGAARGLGIDAVRTLNLFGTGGVVPDLTLLLRLDLATARARRAAERDGTREAARDAAVEPSVDRLEAEGDAFFDAVARAYDELAAAEPARFVVLDASRPPDEVLAAALQALPR